MRDSIDLLTEETGASSEEAELALALSNFNVEEALNILHANHKDILALKIKFFSPSPRLYGLMLLVSNVVSGAKAPIFRLRFVLSDNPNLYETPITTGWFDFEKEIYRARLSEWSYTALSQKIEREWEKLIASSGAHLHEIRQAVESGERKSVDQWLENLMEASMSLRHQLKFTWEGEVMSLRDFRQTPLQANPATALKLTQEKVEPASGGDIFLNLRVALADQAPEAGSGSLKSVSDLRPGDTVFVYVLETRDSGVYMTQIFGGMGEGGLQPIEVPVESVWEESGLTGVRVRFGRAVTGEGTYPKNLRIAAIPQGVAFLSRER